MDYYNGQTTNNRGDCPFEGGRGGFAARGDIIGEILAEKPDAQILFVGSLNCARHKPFMRVAKYMREGKIAFLCPTMTDFASGRYLHEIVDAVGELSAEKGKHEFVLIFSCQWVILSTDGELLQQEVKEKY